MQRSKGQNPVRKKMVYPKDKDVKEPQENCGGIALDLDSSKDDGGGKESSKGCQRSTTSGTVSSNEIEADPDDSGILTRSTVDCKVGDDGGGMMAEKNEVSITSSLADMDDE